MKKNALLILLILLFLTKLISAQSFNYENLQKKNIITVNLVRTPNLSYTRLLSDTSSKAKLIGAGLYYLPKNLYNNNNLQLNQRVFYNQLLFKKNHINISFNYSILNFYSAQNHFTESGISQGLIVTYGYYQKNYFIALNTGLGNNLYYRIKFKNAFYENLYNRKSEQIISARVSPSLGLLGGVSLNRFDFVLSWTSTLSPLIFNRSTLNLNVNIKF